MGIFVQFRLYPFLEVIYRRSVLPVEPLQIVLIQQHLLLGLFVLYGLCKLKQLVLRLPKKEFCKAFHRYTNLRWDIFVFF